MDLHNKNTNLNVKYENLRMFECNQIFELIVFKNKFKEQKYRREHKF